MSIDLTKLAAEMQEAAADRIVSDTPEVCARHALIGALAKLTETYFAEGRRMVSVYDLSNLLITIGNSEKT